MNIIQWFKDLFMKSKSPTLASVILSYNHPFTNYYPVGTKTVNAEVHKITTVQAQQVATLIASEAKRVGLDPLFLAAALNQESMNDQHCYNKNLKEHNGTNSFAGTDWGIAQFSGKYLPLMSGMAGLNQTEMYLKAFDVAWAIPAFANEMLALSNQVSKWFVTDVAALSQTEKLNTTKLTPVEFVTTLSYNHGFSGATALIISGNSAALTHGYRVGTWYEQFVEILQNGKGIPWNIGVNVTWKF